MEIALAGLEKTYKIEMELGRGGMGVVYLATDKRLDRRVAIKVLSLSGGNESSGVSNTEVIERFLREAKAVAKLAHPNIVNIHDISDEDDLYYMVMEFVDGKVLSGMFSEDKPLDPNLVINIGTQICNALDFAHESGIIHRDIKPANIILSRKGVAKLMDFGIASLSDTKEAYKLTQAGSVLGSIMYISPEQLNNASNVDARADIYSLGVSLYELLTGQLPFMAENISSIIMKILTDTPSPPSTYNPEISPALDAIINKAMAKSVEERYQTAAEMGRDLSRVLSGEPGLASTEGLLSIFEGDETVKNMLFPTVILNPGSGSDAGGNGSTVLVNSTQISFTKMGQSAMKKTIVNDNLIKSLEKDFSWLKTLMEKWIPDPVTDFNLEEVFARVTDRSSFENLFSGALIINKEIYTFIYEGYFIGAINITDGSVNQDVFSSLPEEPETIELKEPEEDNDKYGPVIISSLFNYDKPFHINLDSASVDLLPLISNFSSEHAPFSGYVKCYTESNIFYYGYSMGNQIFVCPVDDDDDSIEPETYKDLKTLVKNHGVLLNTYTIKPNLIGPTITNIMQNLTIFMKYRNTAKATLQQVADIGSDEIPNYLLKETKQNTYLELDLNHDNKISILDKEIDLVKVVHDSVYYKFSEWLVNEYFYMLNTTGNTTTLKQIYSWIPAIETIKFFETLEGEEEKKYRFSIVTHGKLKGENTSKILSVVRVGNGEKADLEKFIDDATQIKKKYLKSGDLGSAIYISTNLYTPDITRVFTERTLEPKKSFLTLDASAKFKGFVKLAHGKGFHLNLIEYHEQNDSFKVIAPAL
jgi:serine/threonine protein kinase